MKKFTISSQLEKKLHILADIVHIAFPVLCWILVVLRWSNLWLTEPWLIAVTVLYYALTGVYLFFAYTIRMRSISIVGLFLVLASTLFVWIPYNGVLVVLLIPAMYMAFYNRGMKSAAVILAMTITGFCVLISINFSLYFLKPERYAYFPSADGRYVVLEHTFQWLFFGGTDVELYRTNGPLLISERLLYLGGYNHFGGKIEWIDQNNIIIYGEQMDVFKDATIENYVPF